MIAMLLNVVQHQVQKKYITKEYDKFRNHSTLSTMVSYKQQIKYLTRVCYNNYLYIFKSDQVVPGLLLVLDDTANPRVQAHAAAALVNFCDDCPKNILSSYLDNIVTKLEVVLSSKLREVGRLLIKWLVQNEGHMTR